MDTITAISGSGPAYVFAFMEALVKAAIESGLKEDDAKALVLQTVKGAAELAATSPESFSKLRENVTSPGGTTEAALSILYTPLQEMVSKAVAVAIKRSKEL